STYPEMYDERSTWPRREPAYCPSHRFATALPHGWAVTATEAVPDMGNSRYGAIPHCEAEGFPRHYPLALVLSLNKTAREGFAVMSGFSHGVAPVQGKLLTRQGISLP
ncbi:MAG: hypothetical protein OK436_06830, partial [Thaumarchaeota archaeon]|nr:hypothetical protein [Nitrososphaerota archaeon]